MSKMPISKITVSGTREEQKAHIRRKLIETGGWPATMADEVVDIADHAALEAMRAFERIVSTVSNPMAMTQATTLGLQFITDHAKHAMAKARELAEMLHAVKTREDLIALAEKLAQEQSQ